MRRFLVIPALTLALVGCQAVQDLTTISDAQKAVGSASTAVATVADKSASNLTKTQLSACAGQDAANVLADMLTSSKRPNAARIAADVSEALGYGCTWTQPAK